MKIEDDIGNPAVSCFGVTSSSEDSISSSEGAYKLSSFDRASFVLGLLQIVWAFDDIAMKASAISCSAAVYFFYRCSMNKSRSRETQIIKHTLRIFRVRIIMRKKDLRDLRL